MKFLYEPFILRRFAEGRIFNVNAVSMKQRLTTSTSISVNFRAVTFIYREEG